MDSIRSTTQGALVYANKSKCVGNKAEKICKICHRESRPRSRSRSKRRSSRRETCRCSFPPVLTQGQCDDDWKERGGRPMPGWRCWAVGPAAGLQSRREPLVLPQQEGAYSAGQHVGHAKVRTDVDTRQSTEVQDMMLLMRDQRCCYYQTQVVACSIRDSAGHRRDLSVPAVI